MSQFRSRQEDREHQPLISGASQKRRFPQVFKWKVATIVISVLITIFLITDIILYVNYNNSQPRNNNYTFLSDILSNTNNQLISRQSFTNMAKGLSTSYPDLWFQTAQLISSWNSPDVLNLDTIGNLFDGQADQLFIITMTDGINNYVGAAFSHIAFSLPSGWQDFLNSNNTNRYYTFEIADRQSTIVGGGNSTFLRMSGSTSNLLNCLVVKLQQTTLNYLNMLSIDFSTATPRLTVLNTNPECFQGEPDAATALSELTTILGVTTPPSLTLLSIESYDLSA